MKRQQIKKILSITLAVSLMLASVPIGTSASDAALASQTEMSEEPKETETSTEQLSATEKQPDTSADNVGDTAESTNETKENADTPVESTEGSADETVGSTDGGADKTTESAVDSVESTEGNTDKTMGSTADTVESTERNTDKTTESADDTVGNTDETADSSAGDVGSTEKPKEKKEKPKETQTKPNANKIKTNNKLREIKTVTVVWETGAADEKEWNGKNQAPTARADDIELAYEITKDGSAAAEAKDPGNYTVVAKLAQADDEITLENAEVNFTIKKAQISFTWEIPEVTYTGNAIKLPKATFVSAEDGSEVEAVVSVTDTDKLVNGEVINAGTYHVVAALPTGQENYYEIQGEAGAEFTVKPSPVEIIWNSTEVAYNAESHFLDWKTDYKGDITVKYTDAAGAVVAAPTEAGTYTATAEIADTNYTPTSTGTLTIKPAEAEVKWSNTTLTYNGAVQKPTATFTDVKGNEVTFDATEVETDKESILPGKYTATVSADGYPNYTFTKTSADFEITQMTVQVQWGKTEFTYNGKPQAPTASFTKADGITTVECTVSAQGNPSDANVGDQTYTAEVVGADGYPGYILENTTTTFTIKPAEAEVTWENKTLAYNGAVQKPTATFRDVNGEVVTFVAEEVNTNAESILPGKYTATVSTDGYPNYTFTNISTSCDFEITQMTVEVKWDKTELTYNGAAQKPTAMFIDVKGDEVPCKVEIKDAESQVINATNAGEYTAYASCDDSNYTFKEETEKTTFTIKPAEAEVTWNDTTLTYNGKVQKPTATFIGVDDPETPITCVVEIKDTEGQVIDVVNAGEYTAYASCDDSNYTFKEGTEKTTFTIKPAEAEVKWNYTTLAYNGEAQKPTATFIGVDGSEVPITCVVEIKDTEGKVINAVNAGKYTAYASCDDSNYTLTNNDEDFVISKLPVTITANPNQWKWYGAAEPETFFYEVSINEGTETAITIDKITEELETEFGEGQGKELLQREAGEDAGDYKLSLTFDPADSQNYDITYGKDTEGNDFVYTIKKLPVTVNPTEKQSKIFGEIEPEYYGYSVEINVDKGETQDTTTLTKKEVQKELGDYVLAREAGEAVGKYKFSLIPEDGAAFEKTNYKNFELKVPEEAPTFKINTIKITNVDSINSRQSSFDVTTNLKGDRQKGVTTKFKFEIDKLPTSADGIMFSGDINTYITGAAEGIVFDKASDTIKINTAEYQKQRKDDAKMLSWNGHLPAGTVVKVTVVDENGIVVSAEPKYVTVSPVNVEIGWSGYETSAATGNYVIANGGSVNPLTLSGNRAGEWVEMLYNAGGKREKASYGELNTTFTPSPNNAGSKHVMQTVSANVVDTLNLTCTPQKVQFYVDDTAFAIPSSSIQFENRGKEITIRLPEVGTVTSVNIPGATVDVAGEMGEEFQFPVEWSGMNLIPAGSAISVEYTDQAGHQGTGGSSASRSSVSTPITFQIRPELNANGYLNGRSNTLIVSGAACSCEPIRVTIANMSQTTNATQQKVWSDSNGSWEVLLDMSRLPEGEDFTISAEYMDVDGAGYSITARFDAFCASPATLSPIYEAMTHISGMVEPGTAVALVINGDTQNYQEIKVDRFGRFALDDVPMMFAGDDSFDIYVTDIAGNVSIRHYEIEEPGEPFEVNSYVNPLGKIFYSADESDSVAYAATPVSASDFAEKDRLEIPLLMGMSYEVGTLTLEKTENGFAAYSEIKGNENVAVEDLGVANDRLYVYSSRPTIEDLKNRTGQEYQYGMEIPFGDSGKVWIVNDKDMTVLAEDIINLDLFDFENSEEYAKYQEQ